MPILFGISAVLCVVIWMVPTTANWIGWIWILSLMGTAVWAAVGIFAAPRKEDLLREVDRDLGSDDLALTVADPAVDKSWRDLLGARLSPQLPSVDPKRVWPVRWTRLRKIWLGACVLMGANVFLTASALRPSVEPTPKLSSEDAERFRTMIEEWRELADESEELEEILKTVQPLTGETDPTERTPAEQMELLGEIESVIERKMKAMDENSITELAEEMAELLESVSGMSAAAAALRRGDFAEAAEAMEAGAKEAHLRNKLPEGAEGADFREMAESLANRAADANQQALSEALRQLQEASRTSDPRKWQKGSRQMGRCMMQQSHLERSEERLAKLLEQLEEQKRMLAGLGDPTGRSPGMIAGMGPGNGSPGSGAGTTPGGDPLGEETDLAGEREILRVEGQPAGDGESTLRTIRSASAPPEATRANRPASFSEYHELSTQAVQDESLPLVHRETIRRYFETIRPNRSPESDGPTE